MTMLWQDQDPPPLILCISLGVSAGSWPWVQLHGITLNISHLGPGTSHWSKTEACELIFPVTKTIISNP